MRSVGLAAPLPIPDAVGKCVTRQIEGWRLPPAPARYLALAHVDVAPP